MSHVTHLNTSPSREHVLPVEYHHRCRRGHKNESCRTYEWVMSHMWTTHLLKNMFYLLSITTGAGEDIWMSHVAHMNESRLTYERVSFCQEHVLPVEYHHGCRRGPFWRQVACLQIYILPIANLPPSHSTLCGESLNTEACKSLKRESCSHWIDSHAKWLQIYRQIIQFCVESHWIDRHAIIK